MTPTREDIRRCWARLEREWWLYEFRPDDAPEHVELRRRMQHLRALCPHPHFRPTWHSSTWRCPDCAYEVVQPR